MSGPAMVWAWWHTKVTGTHKLVLLALSWTADNAGRAWPTVPFLAEMCALSDRQVTRVLKELEDMGEIIREVKGGPAPPGRPDLAPSLYHLRTAPTARQKRGDKHVTSVAGTRCHPGPIEVTNSTDRGDTDVTSNKRDQRDQGGPCPHGEPAGPRYCALCRRKSVT